MQNDPMTRRSFVSGMAKTALGFTIVPRHVLGGPGFVAPSDTLNVAMIGAGGMGMSNAYNLVAGGQNIVALADVDMNRVMRDVVGRAQNRDGTVNEVGAKLKAAYEKAKKYSDFRRMLEEQGDAIDAVVVATPDHFHAVAANAAMQLGKHVYVQKPLTYTVHEARVLQETARRTGVVTQMGNQGHSSDTARRVNEWIEAGVLGPVREVHVWTNRPIWPQGVPRPTRELAGEDLGNWGARNLNPQFAAAMAGSFPMPEGLDWDVFIGPSPFVEYHPVYHPFNWRGWVDWGVGALGDMGAHLIDHPFWALKLDLPTTIEATSTPWGPDVDDTPATYPLATLVHYEFAARGDQPPVKMTWYDGGLMPPRPEVLPEDVPLERGGGVIFVGERGILMHETYGENPQIFPLSLREEADRVPETYPRVGMSHEMNWANAAMGNGEATSPFDYAARLTETMLLGLVALRTGQGVKIEYDAASMSVTNKPEANQYLKREYRQGWSL
ncbi:MAG TPA: Gfo/Idh/MocA family oxidoreductase [Longimicrobiaceae bacterium]